MEFPTESNSSTEQWLKTKCEELWTLKQRCDEIERDLDMAKKARNALQAKIQERMEDEGFLRVDTNKCFVTVREESYVTVPKTTEAKDQLFAWLKARGVDMDYLTINYQSLNSLYKTELKETGEVLPGVGPEKVRTKFSIYRQKG